MTTLQHDHQQIRTQPGAAAPGDGPEAALGYWRRKLDGLPRLDLPADRPHAAARRAKTRSVPVRAGAGAVTPLRRIAQTEDAGLDVVLLAAYKVLLAHLTGQRDVVAGSLTVRRRSDHDIALPT